MVATRLSRYSHRRHGGSHPGQLLTPSVASRDFELRFAPRPAPVARKPCLFAPQAGEREQKHDQGCSTVIVAGVEAPTPRMSGRYMSSTNGGGTV